MGKVVSLGNDPIVPAVTPEAVARKLDQYAAQIRSGELDITRAVLCYQTSDYTVGSLVFGAHTNTIEVLGLLDWVAHRHRT